MSQAAHAVALKGRALLGWPFEAGRALVCIGCSPSKPDDDGNSSVYGGKWGFIDKSGKELDPVTLTRAEAMSR